MTKTKKIIYIKKMAKKMKTCLKIMLPNLFTMVTAEILITIHVLNSLQEMVDPNETTEMEVPLEARVLAEMAILPVMMKFVRGPHFSKRLSTSWKITLTILCLKLKTRVF